MSDNFLYDTSVLCFQYAEKILSPHIRNWNRLDFSHQAAWFFWGCVSILFYIFLYSAIIFFAMKLIHFTIKNICSETQSCWESKIQKIRNI